MESEEKVFNEMKKESRKDGFPIGAKVISIETALTKYNYNIPNYQRPYEWGREQIEAFCYSIYDDGFKANNRKVFFGTIQTNKGKDKIDIVDGRQRLTTFVIYLNVIQDMLSERHKYLNAIDDEGRIQEVFESKKGQEKYEQNKEFIKETIEGYSLDREELSELRKFVEKNIYVVFLYTTISEGLPLTDIVTIFNSINTTGLDLNAADEFKFRYYDYLYSIDAKDDWMDKIKGCYEKIDEYNREAEKKIKIKSRFVLIPEEVLEIYKHILCARLEKGYSELRMVNSDFFNSLFRKKKKEEKKEPFLDFEVFQTIVDIYVDFFKWIEERQLSDSVEKTWNIFSYQMIWKTRYSRYWTIPFIAAFFMIYGERNEPMKTDRTEIYEKCLRISVSFFRLFLIYSVIQKQVVNAINNKICHFLHRLADVKNEGYESLCEFIEKNMWIRDSVEEFADEDRWEKRAFEKRVKYNLFDDGNPHLVCSLIELIKENDNGRPNSFIRKKLFNWKEKENRYDIEHIYAKDLFKKEKDETRELMNGVGNLVVLESGINKSIKNRSVDEKMKGFDDSQSYKNSEYVGIRRLLDNYAMNSWDKETVENTIEERARQEFSIVMKFLNGD